ncbi:type VI secretion system Vgr family protein [Pseudomonas aeruginosa]|uniref:type VI secretion system Vgr family protein n=1 Tax=Pseudomonas aeruginosa TaxID=287 RepID=UPI0035592435
MALAQQTRLVRVDSPLGAEVLQLQRMEGREELGRPFAYELELISENPDLPLDGLLGKPASLALELHDGSRRHFHGIVAACSQGSGNGQFASYQVTLRPWLWLLTRTSDCRIFQNQKVPDIIKQVFRDLGFSDFEDALSRSYREWEYCVQYRETSFDFVSRLMEQEGIYYWFRHEQSRHILVLSDAYGAHQSPPNYASVPYYPPTLEQRERDHFYDWHMAREVQSGSLSLNDYDFQRPGARLEVRSNIARSHAAADYPLYDYPGEYVQSQDGEQYARTRIEALQARYERVRLRGRARGLGSGHLFKLSGYPREDQNREYLVVGAEYRVVQELYETGGGGVGAQFESELDCIDAGQAYRPLPTTPLPIVRGPQTNQDIEVENDETHWVGHDRTKTIDHDETVHVKHDRTETVDNNETITIGVDRTEKVGNNEKISIGANRTEDVGSNETISIGVDRTEKVGSNEKISIGANRTEDVGNDETISIGANRSESVGNNETISIGADRSESVGANETIDIGGNQSTSIGKNESRSVGQGRDTSVGKDDSLDVGKSFTLNAGDSITLVTGAASIRMKKDGSIVISGKNITIDGSGAINVKADKNVVVKGRKILQN